MNYELGFGERPLMTLLKYDHVLCLTMSKNFADVILCLGSNLNGTFHDRYLEDQNCCSLLDTSFVKVIENGSKTTDLTSKRSPKCLMSWNTGRRHNKMLKEKF